VPAAELDPREVQDVVGYDPTAWWVGIGCLVLAVLYVLAAVLWRRRRRPPTPRAALLARLEEIEREVSARSRTPRQGHQDISAAVRSAAGEVLGIPASTMTLADLREGGPEGLVELVTLVYPPEFGSDDALASDRFDEALTAARQYVAGWPT